MNKNYPFISERKIRLGFLGCGRISTKHFEAINQHQENLELVAVCDENRQKADLAAKQMHATAN